MIVQKYQEILHTHMHMCLCVFNSMWIENFQMCKLDLVKTEEPEIKLSTSIGVIEKNKENSLFWGAPKSLQMVIAAMKLKDTYSLEGKLWPT